MQQEEILPAKTSMLSLLLRALVCLLILALAFGVAGYFIKNKSISEKRENTVRSITNVTVTKPEIGDYPAIISAMGKVVPAMETDLKARISGEVQWSAPEFVPGGFFRAGDDVLKIDQSNYALELKMKEAELAQAKAALDLEMGQQTIAREELALLEKTTGQKLEHSNLALRAPQLAQAKANLEAARAGLETAQLNLERTVIKAPFNALVLDRLVNLGHSVAAQETLATLVNTDEYWIELSLPITRMQMIDLPADSAAQGSKATIIMDGGRGTREGYVIKTTGALNQQSRLATVLVSVPDPLLRNYEGQDKSALTLHDYVRVAITGKILKNVMRIPNTAMRDGSTLWLVRDGKLLITSVAPLFQDNDYIYLSGGISAEDKIITSTIQIPVEGMEVSVITHASNEAP